MNPFTKIVVLMGRSHGESDSRHRRALRIVRQPTLSVNENTSETLLIGTIADLLKELKKLLFIIRKGKRARKKVAIYFDLCWASIGINYKDVVSLFIYDVCKNHYRVN